MDLKLLKMRCKDTRQHHVMFHELYSVSFLLCIAQNVRFEIPYKVLYFETPFYNIQILCLGVLCISHKRTGLYFEYANDNIHLPKNPLGLTINGLCFSPDNVSSIRCISYQMFRCEVSPYIFTSCALFDEPAGRVKIQTTIFFSNLKEYYKCNRMSARTILYKNQLYNIVGHLYSFRALSVKGKKSWERGCCTITNTVG